MRITVPSWIAVLPGDSERVLDAFQQLLRGVDLTRADLGRRLDLGPSTVGNWASGSKRPSFESMRRTTETLSEALGDLKARVDVMQRVLDLVEDAVEASKKVHEKRTKEAGLASVQATRRFATALDELEAMMGEST